MDLVLFAPDPLLLLLALVLDLLLGDPVYALHPIRVLGAALMRIEHVLRSLGLDGYVGGCLLFVLLACIAVGLTSAVSLVFAQINGALAWGFHLYLLYSLIALRDLTIQ